MCCPGLIAVAPTELTAVSNPDGKSVGGGKSDKQQHGWGGFVFMFVVAARLSGSMVVGGGCR